MKTFKRSQTSKGIVFNKAKVATLPKKHSNAFEKFEDNIFRISNYIKQNLQESLIKQEKQKIHKNANVQNEFKVDTNIFDFGTIKFILNKPKRTTDELLIIKTYLSSMSFLSTLKIPLNNDKLLFSLSIYLKSEKKPKNTVLFRFGNKGNKFYIVLEGEVSILILKERKELISFKRYFLHLLLLKMLKEDELVRKTIIANAKMNYHFDDKDFDGFYEKIAKFANTHFDKNGVLLNNDEKGESENKEKNGDDNLSNLKLNIKSKKVISFSTKSSQNSNKNTNHINIKRRTNILRNSNKNCNKDEKKNNTNNNEENNNNDKSNLTIKKFQIENGINNIRLISKRKTERRRIVSNPLFPLEHQEINYSNVDLPYFEPHEIKEIILYYIFLKEGIEAKGKNVSVDEYIKNTYLNSSFHRPIASEQYSKKDLLIIYQYLEITRKKVGESFGELALQREDNKRTGSVLIPTDCVLGYLNRSDYNTFLGDIEMRKRKNDINFVISFSIFDKMNRNVFENRYFNYFTRENFLQGQTIISQDHKANKIFFIKEGQYEITTNLSISKLYSILQYKTKKTIDDRKKLKIKCQNFNMRLYICYNKDILGLDDCCFKDDISFITAKCITSTGCAFTIEKSILNEIKSKIPDIEGKINIIKESREQVMIDRLMNIYNRIVQSKNKDKKFEKIKFNKEKRNDTIKYINYLFGFNKNKRNNEFKTVSSRTNKNRIQSALPLKKRKIDLDNYNKDNIENNNSIYNSSINQSRKFKTINSNGKNIANSSNTVYFIKNSDNINSIENIKYKIEKKNILPRKSSHNVLLNAKKNFFESNKDELMDNNQEEINNSIKEETKTLVDKTNNEELSNNKIPSLLNKRISAIMTNKKGIYKSKDKKLVLKISKKLNRISNCHTKKKFVSLYHPINEIISNEYSNLINWLDSHESEKNTENNSKNQYMSLDVNKTLLKSRSSSKFYLINKNNKIINKRPLSSTISQRFSFHKSPNKMPDINIFSYDDKKEDKGQKSSLNNKNILSGQLNKNYNRKIISQIISGDINPKYNKKDINIEKDLKRILGTRYKNHYISYEEEKLAKLINQANIQDKFLQKGRRNKFIKKNSLEKNFYSNDFKSSRNVSTRIKFNSNLLKK